MINRNSILFTITITFAVSLLLIFVSFFVLYNSSLKMEEHFSNKRERGVAKMVLRECMHRNISSELINSIKDLNFNIITNHISQNKILKDKNLRIKQVEKRIKANITFFTIKTKRYVYIQTPRNKVILVNNEEETNHQQIIIAIFLTIIFAFILLYFTTIKKLKPLKTLKNKIKNLANEDFDIDCATPKKDEISQLANEFDKTAKKLKQIKESRNIFIRNIMHELKTPITKGKVLMQLPQSEDNINMMQKVFYRLESLISEFATIEELISTKKIINKKSYFLADIIDNANDLLMSENEVKQEYENIKIDVDFNLFSIAIKNLLDNGIKYSKDKKVTVKTNNNKIIFENIGDKLTYPLENYFEPFFKGDDIKSNQSFGLGLYIVKHILEANNFTIEYKYINDTNQFILSH
ncbi:MAG: ArsS family sensor histidine kinase [Campylobacterota bacterium]|nr:ArsS family sensor histidine kinase [Campylobacterota bacterium]